MRRGLMNRSFPASERRRSVYVLWVVLLLSVSCTDRQIHQESSEKAASIPSSPSSSSVLTAQTLAEKVTDAVVRRRIFEITPATVVEKLSGLVEMKKEEPTEYVWQFNGENSAGGVHWAQVQFQPGERGSKEPWQLLQIQLGLTAIDAEQKSVFQSLSSQLAE